MREKTLRVDARCVKPFNVTDHVLTAVARHLQSPATSKLDYRYLVHFLPPRTRMFLLTYFQLSTNRSQFSTVCAKCRRRAQRSVLSKMALLQSPSPATGRKFQPRSSSHGSRLSSVKRDQFRRSELSISKPSVIEI